MYYYPFLRLSISSIAYATPSSSLDFVIYFAAFMISGSELPMATVAPKSMDSMESQAQALINDMLAAVPAPSQYGFDVYA